MPDDTSQRQNRANGSPFLSTRQAGRHVRLSPRTLEKMRVRGGGPKFRKHGRLVVYHMDDLEAWSASRAQSSTSDNFASPGE